MGYRAISKAVSLAAAHANYLVWLQQSTGDRQASYAKIAKKNKDRHVTIAGWIIPFSLSISAKYALLHYVMAEDQSKASNTALATALYTALTGRIDPPIANTTGWNFNSTLSKRFKFAKLSLTQVTSVATNKSNSRITGNLYQKNVTSTVSGEFGQISTGEAYETAVTAILADSGLVTLFASTTNKTRYRFTKEGS